MSDYRFRSYGYWRYDETHWPMIQTIGGVVVEWVELPLYDSFDGVWLHQVVVENVQYIIRTPNLTIGEDEVLWCLLGISQVEESDD